MRHIVTGILLLQVHAARALLRALQHIPSLRSAWGLHNLEPLQALVQHSEADVRWLAIECLALVANLVSCPLTCYLPMPVLQLLEVCQGTSSLPADVYLIEGL